MLEFPECYGCRAEWQLRIWYIPSGEARWPLHLPQEGTRCLDDIVDKLSLVMRNKKDLGYDMTLMWYSERSPRECTYCDVVRNLEVQTLPEIVEGS